VNDTSPEMEARYRAMLLARSGPERLAMGCAMFEDARRLVAASIRAANPNISEAELQRAIFLRFYGHEFEPEQRERILAHIVTAWQRSREQTNA
jgi:hypothetical protein